MATLSEDEIRDFLEGRSADASELILAIRAMVLTEAPGVTEALRFRTLAYFWGDAEYGSIGGNVCMIEPPRDAGGPARLSFIQGVAVPDPAGLLRGTGKAKRFIEIATPKAAASPQIRALVRASAALSRPL